MGINIATLLILAAPVVELWLRPRISFVSNTTQILTMNGAADRSRTGLSLESTRGEVAT